MSAPDNITKPGRRASHFYTIDAESYKDLYTGRTALTDEIADHMLREIQVGEVWGHDPVILTTIQNAPRSGQRRRRRPHLSRRSDVSLQLHERPSCEDP
jgi:hypothetical protein